MNRDGLELLSVCSPYIRADYNWTMPIPTVVVVYSVTVLIIGVSGGEGGGGETVNPSVTLQNLRCCNVGFVCFLFSDTEWRFKVHN